MDTTVVAHFRDQWDHFRAGEGGDGSNDCGVLYSEPEAGGGSGEPFPPG